MVESYILSGGTLILPDRRIERGILVVRDGIIRHVGHKSLSDHLASYPEDRALPVIGCDDSCILPRLTEMHIHGAFGVGFESVGGGADILKIARGLEGRGVSCFVPTILWDRAAVQRLVAAIEASGLPGSVVPGIYIEGPFVNPERRGGIGLPQIALPDVDLCREILDVSRGRLRIMALAPELPGVQALYPVLREAGVLVSLGHSGASTGVPLPPPPFSVTHLYNAMSGLDHRGGGLANIALAGRSAWVELNADGIHVNASAMKVASLCIPPERLVLTSDAVVSAGLGYGVYSYFGKSVSSGHDGVRYSDTGTLIGSSRLGIDIVKSFIAASGASLPAAVASMSRTPSAALGLAASAHGGSIEPGAKADLFIWDKAFSTCHRPGAPDLGPTPILPGRHDIGKGIYQ